MKKNYDKYLNSLKKNLNKSCLLLLIGTAVFPATCYSQQSYTFTTAGVRGRIGPTQTQLNSAYLSTNLSGSVVSTNATSGIQQFTVPTTGLYGIDAYGAEGGTSISNYRIGGLGAYSRGEFNFTAGTVLNILVGQQTASVYANTDQFQAGGGGGGSFIWISGSVTPLVVAGGGGGGGGNQGISFNRVPGQTTTAGSASQGTYTSAGGTLGSGGQEYTGNGGHQHGGSAGGGWLTNGASVLSSADGGYNIYTSGGLGGQNGSLGGNNYGSDGGFGGGGGGVIGGGGGGGYSGGGAGNQPSGSPATSWYENGGGGGGSYNVGANQVNSVGTNTGSGRVIISQLCFISLNASGPSPSAPIICSGNSVSLTTNAVSNYTWSTGNTTSTVLVVSPTTTQTYSVIGTSSANCVTSSIITVTVSVGLPLLSITASTTNLCLGKSATVTASGALTYTWTGGITNGTSFIPTGGVNNYTVSGQNGCGTTTAVATITVAPLPVTAIVSPTVICVGSTATLTAASAVTGYTWQPIGLTGNNAVISPTVNTIYTVTASDGTCSGVTTVLLATKQIPTITIASSATVVCAGAPVTLTASGASTYSWSPVNSNNPIITANPTAPTLYQATGTNSLGCSSSANQVVLTNPSPTVVISANKTLVCAGDAVNLTASGASAYNWANGPQTAANVVNPQVTTTYTVTGTASGPNPCSSDKTILISVLATSVTVSVTSPSICNGGSTTLTASGANSYTWTGFGGFGGNISVSPTVTTLYTLNALTTGPGISCPSSNSIAVTVFNNPTVTVAATKTVMCKADLGPNLTASGANTFTWSTTATGSTVHVSPTSTNNSYSVTGTDANGCVNTATLLIKVNSCTGITELNGEHNFISVYPNPNNGEFMVSFDTDINLELINELGQVIRTINLSEQNDHKVSVSNLASGIYFVTGQNGGGKVNQKIVVTK